MSYYQPLTFPAGNNERRHERVSVNAPGRVRELGAVASAATIKDLSVGGCCLKGTDLQPHSEIWVTIGAAPPIRARVVWNKQGQAGCEFHQPLRRSEVFAITRKS